MEEIVSKKMCTGCTACVNICPRKAIIMKVDSDGFKYPVIDQEKCINCGLCEKTCPVINTKSKDSLNICYVAYNKSFIERMNSSSGSIFSLIANYILNNRGIVIGAAFDNNNHLRHIAIDKKEDLNPLRKSKYLQSDLNDIFKYIKDQTKTRRVLFVGTPCQVAGLKAFMKNNDNLITIDLCCHGVPSPKLFSKFVKELENKYNDKLINYDFRDNESGWDSYSNTFEFINNKISERNKENNYMRLFLANVALRESCYNCNFKLGNKYSDITLGDYWGIKNYYPEMYNKEGVSAIIINTENGKQIFNSICSDINYKKCTIDEITNGNPCLIESVKRPVNRDKFFNDIEKKSTNELVKKYIPKVSLLRRVKNKIIGLFH